MKKLFALLMAALMLLSLAACNSGTPAPAPTPTPPPASNGGSEPTGGEKPPLKVAMECAYAPYNWAQPDDSNGAVPIKDSLEFANGYDVMMAKHVAEALGRPLEIIRLDWDSLVMAVQSGTVDCVIAGQSITPERMLEVDFSVPYYYADIVTLVKNDSKYASAKGISEIVGATGTSQLNTIWYDTALPQLPDIQMQPAQESVPAMLVALDTGRVDLVTCDLPAALAACMAYPNFTILNFSGTEDNFELSEGDVSVGISVQKGNAELLEGINAALAGFTPEDFNDLMEDAITIQPLSE